MKYSDEVVADAAAGACYSAAVNNPKDFISSRSTVIPGTMTEQGFLPTDVTLNPQEHWSGLTRLPNKKVGFQADDDDSNHLPEAAASL